MTVEAVGMTVEAVGMTVRTSMTVRMGMTSGRRAFLPLPLGEGRGEGWKGAKGAGVGRRA